MSASFITLEEGFQQFGNDLNKLQVIHSRNPKPRSEELTELAICRDKCNCVLEDFEEGVHKVRAFLMAVMLIIFSGIRRPRSDVRNLQSRSFG